MAQRLVVIVVDDEPDLRTLLVDILEDAGFRVVGLAHPEQALTLAAVDTPVLFLLDLMMPEMSGIELARRLRAGAFADLVLVALSASASMLRRAADSHLFEETIQKPFELDHLVETLQRYAA
jgi:CheY-like chemotaxis protein